MTLLPRATSRKNEKCATVFVAVIERIAKVWGWSLSGTRLANSFVARFITTLSFLLVPSLAHCQYYSVDAIASQHPNEAVRAYFQMLSEEFGRMNSVAETQATLYLSTKTEVNAFATLVDQQQIVVIDLGLIRVMRSDHEAVAAVLAHELGHLKLRHITKGQQTNAAIQLIAGLAGLALDTHSARKGHANAVGLGQLAGSVGATVAVRAYSREQEREADYESVQIMRAANLDPEGAWRMQLALQRLQGTEIPSLFSTHPTSEERVTNLRSEINTLTARNPVRLSAYPPGTTMEYNPVPSGAEQTSNMHREAKPMPNPWESRTDASTAAILPNPWDAPKRRTTNPFDRN